MHEFRNLARDLEGIDLEVYREFGRDPLEPIIGEGDPQARIALFGRDPGREEVKRQMPFIGAGGQKVRAALYQVLYNKPMPHFQASVDVGAYLFWANTVPYKPLGNKAWSQRVKKQFQPAMAQVLLNRWQGSDVITLGREAFLWFGLNRDKEARSQLEAFWKSEDRFQSVFETTLTGPGGEQRTLRLHPLPHPSPLNAVWYKRFPDLLTSRLQNLGLSLNSWRLDQSDDRE